MSKILKIVSLTEAITYPSQKAEGGEIRKRTAVMQELGGRYEDAFAVTLFGKEADQPLSVGDVVAMKLRFLTHDYNDQPYQDVVGEEIVNLTANLPL
jgi:hypothetical protein